MYNITEIFSSIQGEGRWVGHQMTFVRFAGCNLRCHWCDQPTSSQPEFLQSHEMDVDSIIQTLVNYGVKRVCLTGGEPLLQVDERLLTRLVHRGFVVHVETNGTIYNDFPFHWITVSPKGPIDMRMYDRADELKFVVDENFSVNDVIPNKKGAQIYLTPCNETNTVNLRSLSRTVAILRNHFDWALSVQLHKYINVR